MQVNGKINYCDPNQYQWSSDQRYSALPKALKHTNSKLNSSCCSMRVTSCLVTAMLHSSDCGEHPSGLPRESTSAPYLQGKEHITHLGFQYSVSFPASKQKWSTSDLCPSLFLFLTSYEKTTMTKFLH